MAATTFSGEYKEVRQALQSATFAGDLTTPMSELSGILEFTGPKASLATKLDSLRKTTLSSNEAVKILAGAGLTATSSTAPTTSQFKKVAAVKFLRHLHMTQASGAQSVWVYTAPKVYRKYCWAELKGANGSARTLKAKLDKKVEFFNATTLKHIGEATRLGLVWCQKALIVLAAVKADNTSVKKAYIDRWFAPPSGKLTEVVDKLIAGFKKVVATLNANQIIITDHPPDRGKESEKYTEAYVLTATETPRTVYIEQALFKNYDISVLHDMKKNWARVIVHECTHIDVSTTDEAYAHAGIKPVTKITPAQAAKNADSWAFFAADCDGALGTNVRNRALNGTGGTLTEGAANWN